MLIKRGVILRLDWVLVTKHHCKTFILFWGDCWRGVGRTDMCKHVNNSFLTTMIFELPFFSDSEGVDVINPGLCHFLLGKNTFR